MWNDNRTVQPGSSIAILWHISCGIHGTCSNIYPLSLTSIAQIMSHPLGDKYGGARLSLKLSSGPMTKWDKVTGDWTFRYHEKNKILIYYLTFASVSHNNWKQVNTKISCLLIGRINTVKMSILPKVIYILSRISTVPEYTSKHEKRMIKLG